VTTVSDRIWYDSREWAGVLVDPILQDLPERAHVLADLMLRQLSGELLLWSACTVRRAFWTDVRENRAVVWEGTAPCVRGVMWGLRGDRYVPLYDLECIHTQMSRRLDYSDNPPAVQFNDRVVDQIERNMLRWADRSTRPAFLLPATDLDIPT